MISVNGPLRELLTYPELMTAGDSNAEIGGYIGRDLSAGFVELRVARPDGTVLTKTAVIVDPESGSFAFIFNVDDLRAGFGQLCEVSVAIPGSSKTYEYFLLDVKEPLT